MVQPVNVFDMATKQAKWLADRQATVAANIANAVTPGYRSIDVKPFSEVLGSDNIKSGVAMQLTNSRHMDVGGSNISSVGLQLENNDEVTRMGNDVDVEKELNKGTEVAQEMQFNSSIVKIFNRMYMNILKG